MATEETYKHNLLAGPFRSFFESGQPESVGEYRNSRKHGMFTFYHPNGKIREQGEYIADKKHREWKEYDQAGNLKTTLVYRAGILLPESKTVKK